MTLRAVVTGVGHYLPERIVPNAEFEKTLDTSDEWIRARSGIENRHFAGEGDSTSSMAVAAATAALADAGCTADDVDAIIVATKPKREREVAENRHECCFLRSRFYLIL